MNILDKKIQLVSPIVPSDETPNGYYIYDERIYTSGADYAKVMEAMITENMSHEAFMTSKLELANKFSYKTGSTQSYIENSLFYFRKPNIF